LESSVTTTTAGVALAVAVGRAGVGLVMAVVAATVIAARAAWLKRPWDVEAKCMCVGSLS